MSRPPDVRKPAQYPIYQTAPGPDFMKPVPGRVTHCPIKPGEVFTTTFCGKQIIFRLNLSFYSDPSLVMAEILEIK